MNTYTLRITCDGQWLRNETVLAFSEGDAAACGRNIVAKLNRAVQPGGGWYDFSLV